MRKPQGYAILTDPDARGPQEWDTRTCAHCQRIDRIPPRCDPADIGGLCYGCGGLVCRRCVADARCTPIEARLEAIERRADTLRSYGLG